MRWEVKDENLDLKSLVVEYQVEGVGVWRRVPIKQPEINRRPAMGCRHRRGDQGAGFGRGQGGQRR